MELKLKLRDFKYVFMYNDQTGRVQRPISIDTSIIKLIMTTNPIEKGKERHIFIADRRNLSI